MVEGVDGELLAETGQEVPAVGPFGFASGGLVRPRGQLSLAGVEKLFQGRLMPFRHIRGGGHGRQMAAGEAERSDLGAGRQLRSSASQILDRLFGGAADLLRLAVVGKREGPLEWLAAEAEARMVALEGGISVEGFYPG
ncbi:hypothetical protein TA3x_003871 [Tundrisphaera sp. TA3]|uniref:hypothetical protein n=1 Tax=Tundrisphaera sp. TA3 TaxID=3435775 RepID=UPI003EC0E4C8